MYETTPPDKDLHSYLNTDDKRDLYSYGNFQDIIL